MYKQLSFIEEDRTDAMERKMMTLEEKYKNLTKSLHAKLSEVYKLTSELRAENETLKAAICHNRPIHTERLF